MIFYRLNQLLPDNFLNALVRNLKDIFGIFWIVSAVFLGTSVFFYDAKDFSFNTASDQCLNPLGEIASYISDIFYQFFGVGAWVMVFATFFWGCGFLFKKDYKISVYKIFGIFFAATLFCLSLLGFFDKINFGCMHLFFSLPIYNFLSYYKLNYFFKIICLFCFLVFLVVLWWSLGLTFKDFLRVKSSVTKFFHYIFNLFTKIFAKNIDQKTIKEKRKNQNLADISLANISDDVGNDEELTEKKSYNVFTESQAFKNNKDDKIQSYKQEFDGIFNLPSLDLFDEISQKNNIAIKIDDLKQSAKDLESVLEEFGIKGEIVNIRPGPVVTMYELKPSAGIKTSRVIGLADDIARSMSALSARIAVIAGQNVIGIELPNKTRQTVYMKNLLISKEYQESNAILPIILGQDIGGNPVIADLAKMPHLLVAGTTGSGKSVSVNAMILSLLYKLTPERCKLIMIDPKMLELSVYDDIPHLLTQVVTDPKKAIVALKWAVKEMENRYKAMSKLGVRNIDGYNAKLKQTQETGEILSRRVQTGFDPDTGKPIFEEQPMNLEAFPYIVVVVDEMADLMLVAGKEIEAAVQRLAQMARAAGIHLIMATQRPSVDVITGTIKANFPTRISFQVTSKIDSRTILGEQGAEQLLGQGDMLYMMGGGRIYRVHGPFVKDKEVERVVGFLKTQGEPDYVDSVTQDDEEDNVSEVSQGKNAEDEMYTKALNLVLTEGKVSTSFIQRHLQIGYNRAARIVEQMEKEGIISPANHSGKREILRS